MIICRRVIFFIMLKLDVIGTLVMMILVDLMPIAKREMMLPYAHAHQVDIMTQNNENALKVIRLISIFQSSKKN